MKYIAVNAILLLKNRTMEVEASMPELQGAWQHVRDKLKGELLGVFSCALSYV